MKKTHPHIIKTSLTAQKDRCTVDIIDDHNSQKTDTLDVKKHQDNNEQAIRRNKTEQNINNSYRTPARKKSSGKRASETPAIIVIPASEVSKKDNWSSVLKGIGGPNDDMSSFTNTTRSTPTISGFDGSHYEEDSECPRVRARSRSRSRTSMKGKTSKCQILAVSMIVAFILCGSLFGVVIVMRHAG